MINSFVEKLELELNNKQLMQVKARIHAPEDRHLSAWIGGSVLCSL
jgi:actin-related protein